MGEYLRGWYETPTFEEDLRELLRQLQPLYSQLHAYVRARLQKQYPQNHFPKSGHIPAHILGKAITHVTETVHICNSSEMFTILETFTIKLIL